MITTTSLPNVFLLHVAPLPSITPQMLEKELFALTERFVLPACPHMAPKMFTHRIMRDAGGSYLWEIFVDGFDMAPDEGVSSDSIEQAVRSEAEQGLGAVGVIQTFAAYANLSIPEQNVDLPVTCADGDAVITFGSGDELRWNDYAKDSGTANAGKDVSATIVESITQIRAEVPSEPNLKPYGKGHVYFALEDKAHRAWLNEYFEAKMAAANTADKRKIRAFAAFQTREGTTASINTYDNQIVTWGTGWGGLGWLGSVMTRALTNSTVRLTLESAGVRYRKSNTYDIVDLGTKRVITGKQEALEVMRASLPLLNLLIKLARAPETREAIADAQLGTFFISAGDVSKADAVASQALFNMISHLKHWAPGYATGCLEWAVPQVADQPVSTERDKQLARLVGRYFYGKARGKSWIPDWKQFQGYWRHMKEDGLDCLNDPFIQASSYPTDDPFATTAAASTTRTTTATTTTNATPASSSTTVSSTATTSQGSTEAAHTCILRSALFAGVAELETVAQGKATLRRGAQGSSIATIQQALLKLGFQSAGANGIFDEGMERAVKAFQKARGLAADGIIGPRTIKKMDEALDAC
jgi:hypothetical protein